MPDRIKSIDIARAICIVLVVIGHYFPDGSPLWYCRFRNWIYSFHMPAFMFISGYVYNLTQRSAKRPTYLQFIRKKARRLLVPYFVVSFIIILLKLSSQYLLKMQIKNPIGPDAFLKIFLGPEAAVHLWFILALWWIFVIVPLFRSKSSHIVLLAAGTVLHYLPAVIPSISYPEIFCLDYSARHLIFFAAGMVIQDYELSFDGSSIWVTLLAVAAFAANSLTGFCHQIDPYIGVAGILGLSTLTGNLPDKALSSLMTISKSSYTIYLVHSIFLGFIISCLKPIPALLNPNGPLFAAGAVLIVTASIYCCIAVHILLMTSGPDKSFG